MNRATFLAVTAVAASLIAGARPGHAVDLSQQLRQAVPREPLAFDAGRAERLEGLSLQIESWAAERSWSAEPREPQVVLEQLSELLHAQRQVDEQVEAVLQLRSRFAGMAPGPERREWLRGYLRVANQLIELSGRLRFLTRDAVEAASYELDPFPRDFERMLDLLIEHRSIVGAHVMSYVLFDPPPESGLRPFSPAIKQKELQLIAAARDTSLLVPLAQFLRDAGTRADLLVQAAETVRHIGLPQDPLRGDEPPGPALTARQLAQLLERTRGAQLAPELVERRDALQQWLAERDRHGVREEMLRVGQVEVAAGDWLLMRNPSPYNRFTDLSPGLFTHVGIVTELTGPDGKRRLVIVDLPERGDHIPATNVEVYLQRTLHYVFLRHEDAKVTARMAEIARQLIGNPTQFDLLFRTDRVRQYKGRDLENETIHTYCAGLLLLCAQETGAAEQDFFPILEQPAGGHCLANLKQLGLSIGNDFVSPTGAIFSPHLRLVGRNRPMYDPGREIKEAVYDHFATSMVEQTLHPSPDAYQLLREKVAAISSSNRWLAQLLARASNVSAQMDLESAARAAAVVETLDEIAEANMRDYYDSYTAILLTPEELQAEPTPGLPREQILALRERHRELIEQSLNEPLTPAQLRRKLVDYYSRRGRQQLDDRFFRP